MKIDYLSADSHKWLLGPEAAGVFFIRRELIEQTHPSTIGWLNVTNPTEFGKFNFVLKSTAQRFECGSLNVPGLLAFKASLELLQSVGIEQIAQRIHTLTDHLFSGLKQHDFRIASPRANQQWSGIVSFIAPRGNHETIVPALRKNHKIEIALRLGRLRCSPHFYNTEVQMDRLVKAIAANLD
jgi:selenocysteine lyase/cysteine desulfurase